MLFKVTVFVIIFYPTLCAIGIMSPMFIIRHALWYREMGTGRGEGRGEGLRHNGRTKSTGPSYFFKILKTDLFRSSEGLSNNSYCYRINLKVR